MAEKKGHPVARIEELRRIAFDIIKHGEAKNLLAAATDRTPKTEAINAFRHTFSRNTARTVAFADEYARRRGREITGRDVGEAAERRGGATVSPNLTPPPGQDPWIPGPGIPNPIDPPQRNVQKLAQDAITRSEVSELLHAAQNSATDQAIDGLRHTLIEEAVNLAGRVGKRANQRGREVTGEDVGAVAESVVSPQRRIAPTPINGGGGGTGGDGGSGTGGDSGGGTGGDGGSGTGGDGGGTGGDGSSGTGGDSGSGTGGGKADQINTISEAEELLKSIGGRQEFQRVLQQLPTTIRGGLSQRHSQVKSQIETGSQGDKLSISKEEMGAVIQDVAPPESDTSSSVNSSGSREISAQVYIYYDYPGSWFDGRAITWHQNVEWSWSSKGTLTSAAGRAWLTRTDAGELDQWEIVNKNITEEGGVGKNHYRYYSTVTVGMCFPSASFGCVNERDLWIDMAVYPGGRFKIDTIKDKGV